MKYCIFCILLLLLGLSFAVGQESVFDQFKHVAKLSAESSPDSTLGESVRAILVILAERRGSDVVRQNVQRIATQLPAPAQVWWKKEVSQSSWEASKEFPCLLLTSPARVACYGIALQVLLEGSATSLSLREEMHQTWLKEPSIEKMVGNYLQCKKVIPANLQVELRNELIPVMLQRGWDVSKNMPSYPQDWALLQEDIRLWAVSKLNDFRRGNEYSDGFQKGQRIATGEHIAVADHPLVLHALSDVVKQGLDKKSVAVEEYLELLVSLCSSDYFHFHAVLPFLAEVSAHQKILVPSLGKESDPDAHWLWRKILYPTIEMIAGWDYCKISSSQFVELFWEHPRWKNPILGGKSCSELVLEEGKHLWINTWKTYSMKACERAEYLGVDTHFSADQVDSAYSNVEFLTILARSPWSSPWVGESELAEVLESSLLQSWCYKNMTPSAQYKAFQEFWPKLLSAQACINPKEKLLSLDAFHPWETMRASFVNIGRWQSSPTPNDWKKVGDKETLFAIYYNQVKDWIAKPSQFPTDEQLHALSILAWLGLPVLGEECNQFQQALAIASDSKESTPSQKTILRAIRFHFIATLLMSGETVGSAFRHPVLWGADEIQNLPLYIEELYQDGRPFCVRSAVEMTWILGKRAILADPLGRLPEVSSQCLQKLVELTQQASEFARSGSAQGGFGLALLGLDWELNELERERWQASTPSVVNNPSQVWLESFGRTLPNYRSLGKSYWGVSFWINLWQRESDHIRETKLLTISPSVEWKYLNIWNTWLRPSIGNLCAFLSGQMGPSIPQQVFLRRDGKERGIRVESHHHLGLWLQVLQQNDEESFRSSTETIFTCFPWSLSNPKSTFGMLQPLLKQASLLEMTTPLPHTIPNSVDWDGIPNHCLPTRTWGSCKNDLEKEIRKIGELEKEIGNQWNAMELKQAIQELKPLLSAPLVVNLSSFREDLQASIAEVRRAEAQLAVKRHESLALEMELLAQDLLIQVSNLEEKRVSILLDMQKNEVERANLQKNAEEQKVKIADCSHQIKTHKDNIDKLNVEQSKLELKDAQLTQESAQLVIGITQLQKKIRLGQDNVHKMRIDLAKLQKARKEKQEEIEKNVALALANETKIQEANQQIEELSKKKNEHEVVKVKLEAEQIKIEIGMAARSIAVLQNQITLIKDVISTPQPYPSHSKYANFRQPQNKDDKLSGRLGVLAYQAEFEVQEQIRKIKEQKEEAQKQLDKLREGNCIKGVCKFIGSIVGGLIGGPFGVILGGSIGGAAGELITGIIQKKPVGQIFTGLLDDGLQIATIVGLDVEQSLNSLGKSAGVELGSALGKLENTIGPILKEMPNFIDEETLQTVLHVAGINEPTQKILKSAQNIFKNMKDNTSNLDNLGTAVVKTIGKVAVTGNPEQILEEMENHLFKGFQKEFHQDLKTIQESAKELGVQVEGLVGGDEEVYRKVAHRVAILAMGKAMPHLHKLRDQLLGNSVVWLALLQQNLQANSFGNLKDAIQSVCVNLPEEEKKIAHTFLDELLKDIKIRPNQAIQWNELSEPLRKNIQDFFPNSPEKTELMLGQIQSQVDSNGMQAQVQETMQPWHTSLEKRLDGVKQVMDEPISSTEQKGRIQEQISQLDRAEKKLSGDVLSWLQGKNNAETKEVLAKLEEKEQEYKQAETNLQALKKKVSQNEISMEQAKIELQVNMLRISNSAKQVEIAKIHEKNAGLLIEKAGIEKEQAELLVKQAWIESENAEREVQISGFHTKIANLLSQKAGISLEKSQKEVAKMELAAKNSALEVTMANLYHSVATLASQQASIALKNAELDQQRTILEHEQRRLHTQKAELDKKKVFQLLEAKRKEVDAAAASLDIAIAQHQGMENRSVVYGKIQGWYRSVMGERKYDQATQRMVTLRYEHRLRVEKACSLIREMLRLIRVGNGNDSGFRLPQGKETWSLRLHNISEDLSLRYKETVPRLGQEEIELTADEIQNLFSDRGLILSFQFQTGNLSNHQYFSQLQLRKVYLPPKQHARVVVSYIMAGKTDGAPVDQTRWTHSPIEHDSLAKDHVRNVEYLYNPKFDLRLEPWNFPLPKVGDIVLDKDIVGKIRNDYNILNDSEVLSIHDSKGYLGMPLLGTMLLQVKHNGTELPQRVRLVFVYQYQKSK